MNGRDIAVAIIFTGAMASCALNFFMLWYVDQWQSYAEKMVDLWWEESWRRIDAETELSRFRGSGIDSVITLLYKYSEKEYINRTEADQRGIEPYMCGHSTCGFVREAREEGLHMGWARWETKNGTAAHATAVWLLFPDPVSGRFLNDSSYRFDAVRIVNGSYFGGINLDFWEDDYCD